MASGTDDESKRFVVRAEVGAGSLWRLVGDDLLPVTPREAGLSVRLVVAFDDWTEFFQEVAGDLGDPEVSEEFVSQGFKIAHRLRAEIKGSEVRLVHPATGESVTIERNSVR